MYNIQNAGFVKKTGLRMKWISVKDKLPEENEWIIVGSSVWEYTDMGIYLVNGNEDRFVNPDLDYFIFKEVTHWMPMPLPPEVNHD